MSTQTCQQGGCSSAALQGKHHCLSHHKEQASYSYGLDHDIAVKLMSKWDGSKAALCCEWIASRTNSSFPGDRSNPTPASIQEWLKSGVLLCQLLNSLWPQTIVQINSGKMPFVQRENVAAYLTGCRKVGLRETDLFVTEDLFEGKNLIVVIDNICALGQLAKDKKISGPQLSISHGAVLSSTGGIAPTHSPIDISQQAHTSLPLAGNPAIPTSSSAAVVPSASSTSSTTSTLSSRYCGGCGEPRAGNNKFCGQCGKPFQ